MERSAIAVLLVCSSVLAVAAVVERDAWQGVTAAVGLAWPVALLRSGGRRRQRSAAATGRWQAERVRSVTAGERDEASAVRAVRRADPHLSLVDAVRLVRETPQA